MRLCDASPLLLIALFSVGCKGSVRASESQGAGGIGPPDDPSSVDYVSGTRLRAQVYVSDSGARKLHGWLDTKTGQTCSFARAADGRQRCVPNSIVLVGYIDPACTEKAVLGSMEAGTELTVVGVQEQGSCSILVHKLGPATHAWTIYAQGPSGCQVLLSLGAAATVWRLGPEMDPSELVGATWAREPRGSQLALQYLDAEDGSRQAKAPFDLIHETSCRDTNPAAIKQLAGVCVPAAGSRTRGKFADSSCAQPVAQLPVCPGAEGDHPFALALEQTPCPPYAIQAVMPLGETLSTAPYELFDGQCEPSTSLDAGAYALTGDAIPMNSLPGIGRKHDGAGVVAEWLVTTDGQRLMVDDFYDTMAGARCRPSLAIDCKVHCLPLAPFRYLASLDPACTQHLAVDVAPDSCESDLPSIVTATEFWGPCKATVTHVLQTGKAVSPPPHVYIDSDCIEATFPSTTVYYEATEIPPSQFPEVVDATE